MALYMKFLDFDIDLYSERSQIVIIQVPSFTLLRRSRGKKKQDKKKTATMTQNLCACVLQDVPIKLLVTPKVKVRAENKQNL